MDVLKRWARLVKGLQIRRRLQAQYQQSDTGGDHRGDIRDVDASGKPTNKQQIVVGLSGTDPEPCSGLQGSHDIAAFEVGVPDAKVRYPRGRPLPVQY